WYVFDKSLGDVLYASVAYLVFASILVRQEPWKIALTALTFCATVESFKLTGWPAQYGRFFLVRWLLGSVFSWHNLVCYAVGIAIMYCVDVGWLRRKLTSPESSGTELPRCLIADSDAARVERSRSDRPPVCETHKPPQADSPTVPSTAPS